MGLIGKTQLHSPVQTENLKITIKAFVNPQHRSLNSAQVMERALGRA